MIELDAFITGLPKAELHLHIEGTLEPQMLWDKANAHNIRLPHKSPEEIGRAYNFGSLQDFLDIYYRGMQVLKTERDFYDLGMAYYTKAAADNVRHVEMFFDPQAHTNRVVGPSVPFEVPLYGLAQAQADAKEKFGITSGLIICFLRHLDEADAFRTLEQVKPHRGRIIAVGLDSGERGNPPSKFTRVFAAARDEGLHIVAHAAEEGPAHNVHQAVHILGVERVDHGNRLINKARNPERERQRGELIALMRDQGIGLTMCPLSNLKLRGIKDMKRHPIRKMTSHGLLVSINSDDPAYFGGYINANFRAIAEARDLTKEELAEYARDSFRMSFLGGDEKKAGLQEVDLYAAGAQRSETALTRTPAGIIIPRC